ncbi:hypothetical protein [Flammeovirga pacifica]|uniref:Uncharacterized protein n=1 Tax=Flammeovirga pacifica TaxID=915059 RepID=A0A1S1Z3B0_FLAPC|nr:hypothetical protein [Flammeovirga pacifica]OHX67774.1 hypothetical protein NH26_16225 [Flammeovirga pacifica]
MSSKLLNNVKSACQAAGKSFIYSSPEENDDSQVQFQFISTKGGEEKLMDAFLYTLEMEYVMKLHEEAVQHVINENPKFADADFDTMDGPHMDAVDEAIVTLSKDDTYDVGEFVEERPEDEEGNGTPIDICLHVAEVTDEVVEKFVKEYNDGSLKIDETVRSFDI